MDNTPIILRVKFKKTGQLQYISHLDLVRTMHKVVVRSALPLWYTEGFNPKPKLVFAAPLSVGTESVTEFLDVRLKHRIDPENAMIALNKNMTDEMQILSAYYPKTKPTDLKWFEYSLRIHVKDASETLADKVQKALSLPVIEVMKKGKKGESLVDIRPLIKSAQVSFDGKCLNIGCILSADSCSFLNPEHIIKYLRTSCGILTGDNLLDEGYEIMRQRAYCEDMSEFL